MKYKSQAPAPTYVATFDDNTVGRASFYSPAGKPFAFEDGRKTCAVLFARPELKDSAQIAASFFKCYPHRTIIDGYVEYDKPGQPRVRVRDPHFAEPTPKVKVRRVNYAIIAKQAIEHVRNGKDSDALALLRELAKQA